MFAKLLFSTSHRHGNEPLAGVIAACKTHASRRAVEIVFTLHCPRQLPSFAWRVTKILLPVSDVTHKNLLTNTSPTLFLQEETRSTASVFPFFSNNSRSLRFLFFFFIIVFRFSKGRLFLFQRGGRQPLENEFFCRYRQVHFQTVNSWNFVFVFFFFLPTITNVFSNPKTETPKRRR